jgi:hypothetical protein
MQGLTCPISTDLFKDPVRLVQTQRTYERREIEKWLAMGGTTDPETSKHSVCWAGLLGLTHKQ